MVLNRTCAIDAVLTRNLSVVIALIRVSVSSAQSTELFEVSAGVGKDVLQHGFQIPRLDLAEGGFGADANDAKKPPTTYLDVPRAAVPLVTVLESMMHELLSGADTIERKSRIVGLLSWFLATCFSNMASAVRE